MPRDHFFYSPDGLLVMQAWISTFAPDRNEEELTLDDRTHVLTPVQWQRFLREREKGRGTAR